MSFSFPNQLSEISNTPFDSTNRKSVLVEYELNLATENLDSK